MLSAKEEEFIQYWQTQRLLQKKNAKQFLIGLTIGLSIGASTLFLIFSGWYQRATMVANTRLSPMILIIIIVAISVFMAYLYRNYKWEVYEQQYLELLAKKKKAETTMQQTES